MFTHTAHSTDGNLDQVPAEVTHNVDFGSPHIDLDLCSYVGNPNDNLQGFKQHMQQSFNAIFS